MRWALLFAALACGKPAATAAAADATADKPPETPAAAGAALVVNNCLACHEEDLLKQQRLSAKQWDAVVKKMQGWGAPIEPENVAKLVADLSVRYGSGAGPYLAAEIASAEAAAAIDPVPDGAFAGGDGKRGKTVYDAQCASCHGPDARGGPMGTNLYDLWILYRAADFAAITRAGRGRMPAFKASDREVADVLAWLRGLRAEGRETIAEPGGIGHN